jgi:DNA/RNA endonuclease YhcR with UshA esterase domain
MSLARSGRWIQRGLLLAVLLLIVNTLTAPVGVNFAAGQVPEATQQTAVAAAATWPVSTGMLVSEVVTRGAAASDQFVELYNASSAGIDLAGLELVYVTASGLTVTRKQTWTSLVVPSRSHVLIANASGIYAATADGLFSNGGFSTTGGALVLRVVSGGAVIDSLAWGTAANAFVEGSPGAAPPTGSSLERKPGGMLGNATDTNDNLADMRLEPAPLAQNLASPPVPGPAPSPSPTVIPTAQPTETPTPEATATASAEPTTTPMPTGTPVVTPEPTPEPTPTPTAAPTPASTPAPTPEPTPTPTPTPTEEPTPTPTVAPLTVSQARALPLGTNVTIAAQLTTPTGLTESGHGAFVQDATGGIALYLTSGEWPALDQGANVIVTGTLETRYSLLTLRVADSSWITATGNAPSPPGLPMLTGEIGEFVESQLVAVQATVTDGISTLTDGFSTAVDDGTGSLRVIAATAAGISPDSLTRGTLVALTGVVGQRDTSGTGAAGYRLHLRGVADVVPLAAPSASPTATPEPTATASAQPSAAITPTPEPTAEPTATPDPIPATISIAAARALAVGESATVQGTVTVEPNRLPDGSLIAIGDGTSGIYVNLPSDAPAIARGDLVTVTGVLAAPYGNLELRPASGDQLISIGPGSPPAPVLVTAAQLGEATEGLLASVAGTLTQVDSTTTSLTLFVDDGTGEARIFTSSAMGLDRADFILGSHVVVTGLVADRLGLYRIWPRERADIVATAPPSPSPSPTPAPTSSPAATPAPSTTPTPPVAPEVMAIAAALHHTGQTVAITATVTSPTGLLDADGRRVTVEDGSGAVLVRLPEGTTVRVGDKLLIIGEVGTYYGAPQLAASDPPLPIADAKAIAPTSVKSAPLATKLEWRLVTVTGGVTAVTRDGDNWHAEVAVPGGSIPIDGLSRSGIASTALVVGRTATVVGIVKRAFPTASDQRLAVVPRSGADISLGGSAPKSNGVPAGQAHGTNASGAAPGASGDDIQPGVPRSAAAAVHQTLAIALSDLASHESEIVIVGGHIDAIDGDRLLVNDGTSLAAVRLPSTAGIGSLRVGALVNARGRVTRTEQGGLEVVVEGLDAIRILGALTTIAQPSAASVDSQAVPKLGGLPVVSGAAPVSSALPFVLVGMLALAIALPVAGIVIARRPDLARSAVRALRGLRAQR